MKNRHAVFWIGTGASAMLSPLAFYVGKLTGSLVVTFIGYIVVMLVSYFVVPRLVSNWLSSSGDGMFATQKEGSRAALAGHAQAYMITKEYEKAFETYRELLYRYPHDIMACRSILDILYKELQDTMRTESVFRDILRDVKDKKVQQKMFKVYHECTKKVEVELL